MKQLIRKWIKSNKYTLLLLAMLCVTSALSIRYIMQTAVTSFDGSVFYENISEYDFNILTSSVDKKPIVEELPDAVRFSWDELDTHFYATSFDRGVGSAPSSAYADIATIPNGAKEIQLDISIRGKYITDPQNDINVQLYLITYNSEGQVEQKSIPAEFKNSLERPRNFGITVDVDENAQYYKVLLRISPRSSVSRDGYVEISRLDITFR